MLTRVPRSPCRTDCPLAVSTDSPHFTPPSITVFCLLSFPVFVPKHLPPPCCLFPQLLPHTCFLCCSPGTPSPSSISLPQSCCSFPSSTVSPLSFRQHCRHSPDSNNPGLCPAVNHHCPQGPQVPSSVMGRMRINHRAAAFTFDSSHRSAGERDWSSPRVLWMSSQSNGPLVP